MYLQRWHGRCHMKLLPSRRVLCTPYNYAPCHFMQSYIRKMHACLAVTCHLQFWQIDQDLLRAVAITRAWNGYGSKRQHRKLTLEKKILPPLLQGFRPTTNHESGALTTELFPLETRHVNTLMEFTSLCFAVSQVRVTVGDSDICCCVHVASFERLLSPVLCSFCQS